MKAFRVLSVLVIGMFDICIAMSQEIEQYKSLIRVEQTFHGWVECHSHTPVWNGTSLTIGDSSKTINADNNTIDFPFYNIKEKDGKYYLNDNTLTLTMKLSVGRIEHNKDWNEENLEIKLGKKQYPHSDSERCGGFGKKREGYNASMTIIFDNPIDVFTSSDTPVVVIENEKLSLKFNEFYNNGKEYKLEYKLSSEPDNCWKEIAKRQYNIPSGGTLSLSYEDVVGENSDSKAQRYKECSGRTMNFRVVKTLLDDKKTYGHISIVRFYHKGPEFTIEDIRWPYCQDSVEVFVDIDSEAYSKATPNEQYEWVVEHSSGRPLQLSFGTTTIPNRYKLSICDDDGDYLNAPDAQNGEFKIQLQLKDEEGKDVQGLAFDTEKFKIPAHLDSIKASQSGVYLFEYNGTKYHLTNAINPYVVLNITDNDSTERGRLPYKIYDSEENLLAEINTATIDNVDIDAEKQEWLAKNYGDKEKEAFIKKQAYKWGRENKKLKLFYTNEVENNENSPDSNVLIDDNQYFRINYIANVNSNSSYLYKLTGNYETLKKTTANPIIRKVDGINSFYKSDYKYYVDKNTLYSYESSGAISNYDDFINKRIEICKSKGAYTLKNVYNKVYLVLIDGDQYYHFNINRTVPQQIKNTYLINEIKNDKNIFVDVNGSYIVQEDNKIHYYPSISDSKVQTYILTNTPKSPKDVKVNSSSISYNVTNGKSYEEFFEDVDEETFWKKYKEKEVIIDPNDIKKIEFLWLQYLENCWNRHYLETYGYHIHGIKINQNDTLTLTDNDGCSYSIPYRVNVLDNLKIDLKSSQNPTNGNDGKATLIVVPGGKVDYYYDGEKIEKATEISLSNLHWGNNEVVFYDESGTKVLYTYSINLTPNVSFSVTPQTCAEPNGKITPTGADKDKCTSWQHKNPSMPNADEYWGNGLSNLTAGTYNVRGYFNNKWIEFEDVLTIENKIFSIKIKEITNATEIGGTGSVTLIAENTSEDFSIDGAYDNNVKNNELTYTDLKPQRYSWTAINGDCAENIDFEIKRPEVKLVNASATFDADQKTLALHLEGLKNELVSEYIFVVDDVELKTDMLIADVNSESSIALGLQYQTTESSEAKEFVILENLSPTSNFSPSAIANTGNATRCPSELGTIDVTNCNYSNCEYSVDGGQFQPLGNNKTIQATNGMHSITFRLHSTEHTTLGNIEIYTIHKVSDIEIVAAQQPIISVAPTNVTCFDANNGEITIIETENIRGNAQISLDGEVWTTDAISNLAQGIYTIYQRDDLCPADISQVQYNIDAPTSPLQINTTSLAHPSCGINDGKISVEVSGGWSEAYKVLTDTIITDDLLDDETGYSDEMQHTFEQLSGGMHTIYVADAGGCVSSISATLNDHAPGIHYMPLPTDASCFDFVDGSISITSIKGFNSASYILTKASEVIAQEEITFEGDSVLINNALRAGNDYSITLRNDEGCIGSDRFYINQPPKIELELGPDVTICPNNAITFTAGNYSEFCWQRDGKELSTSSEITVDKSGRYRVDVTDSYGCHAADEVSVEVGNSALQANFLMSSDVALSDTIVLIELSNMQPDNIEWLYPDTAFDDVTPPDAESYLLYLKPKEKGTFFIEMKAYAEGCESADIKQLMVLDELEEDADFKIGYDPLIKQVKVSPNPSNGEFDLIVSLREAADIDVTIHDVNNGKPVEHFVLKESDNYTHRINISRWGSGIFVLSITSRDERRAVKVLSVR